MSGPRTLSARARHCLCRVPALSRVSGPGALCVGPSPLCVGATALSVSEPGAGFLAPYVGARRSLRRARCSLCHSLLFSVSGPGTLCVGTRRSLALPGALSLGVGARCSLCLALCVRAVCGSGALCRALSSDPRATDPVGHGLRAPTDPRTNPSGPRAPGPPIGPLRYAAAPIRAPPIRPRACHPSDPRAPSQIRVPPIQPGAVLFAGENPKPYCLGDKEQQNLQRSPSHFLPPLCVAERQLSTLSCFPLAGNGFIQLSRKPYPGTKRFPLGPAVRQQLRTNLKTYLCESADCLLADCCQGLIAAQSGACQKNKGNTYRACPVLLRGCHF